MAVRQLLVECSNPSMAGKAGAYQRRVFEFGQARVSEFRHSSGTYF